MDQRLRDAAIEAARRHGTPAYLYDLPRLRDDARRIARAFADPWLRLYSLKANGLPALAREVAGLGYGASAVSRGELALAARAGIGPERTALEGIGKTTADLRRAVALAVEGRPLLWVALESADEAAELSAIASAAFGRRRSRAGAATRLDVLVRVNPSVHPETGRGLAVGAVDSKFGVLPDELERVVAAGGGPDGPLRWRGIHLHVGSQLGAVDAWRSAFRLGLRLLELQRAVLRDFDTLDAGSGFPVGYGPDDRVPPVERFAAEATVALADLPQDARPTRLAIEPGRAVVAGCGWLVARVLHVRQREMRTIVLDAGMTELPRPALYGAEHPIAALTSRGIPVEPIAGVAPTARVDGPVCESTDRLGEAALPDVERGDLVAVGMSGAYASAMASTYNGRPRAVELAWDGERVTRLRPRGTLRALP